jgi:hypothetical protein
MLIPPNPDEPFEKNGVISCELFVDSMLNVIYY